MKLKTLLFLSILTLAALVSPKTLLASGISVTSTNSHNPTSANLADYHGNSANVQITIKNTTTAVKKLWIELQSYKCDFGGSTKACFDNGKSTGENVTLNPGQTITRSVSQSTPQASCGSTQVDAFVSDITTGVKLDRQGPFWDFAYTGKDCAQKQTGCPTVPAASLNGKVYDVGYATGLHWIVGFDKLKKGADYVYYLGPKTNPKNKVLQCFYPQNEDKRNIQTDWTQQNTIGWIKIENGLDFGLNAGPYWAKNTFFQN